MHALQRPSLTLLPILLVILAGASGAHAGEQAGLRFDSPGVLDLSARESPPGKPDQRIAAMKALPAAVGDAIIAAPALGEDEPLLPFVNAGAKCKEILDKCVRKQEAALIGREAAEVSRTAKRLLIQPKTSAAVAFIDWHVPATANADGDSTLHVYAGRLEKSPYHRVEVQFGHDAPGSFLVNPENGKVAFVHNGADVAAAAPDGTRMVVFNTLNLPLSINVARLDDNGPSTELHCTTANPQASAYASFKGWQNGNAFHIVLKSSTDAAKGDPAIPVRFELADGAWSVATANPARLQETFGLLCRN